MKVLFLLGNNSVEIETKKIIVKIREIKAILYFSYDFIKYIYIPVE